MKYILSISILLIASSTYAQSKKELRAQIVAQQLSIDSLHQAIKSKDKTIDTLAQAYVVMQRNYTRQLEIAKDAGKTYDVCRKELAKLEQENARLAKELAAAKPPVKSKNSSTNKTNIDTNAKEHHDNPFGDNPFAGGGVGGNGSGKGAGIGNDHGEGYGPGTGEGKGPGQRYIIAKPNTNGVISEETCTISFLLEVSPAGLIVAQPICKKAETTTDDLELIKQVTDIVFKEVKYNKTNGTINELLTLKINIKAK